MSNLKKKILFTFSGFVKKAKGRGKKLGFPTANIQIPLDLPEGIYVGYTQHKEKKHPSLIFIGSPITFKEFDKKAEIYILDYSNEIYDEFLEVEVLKKIRDNMKFDSKEALIEQMKKDEEEGREYFKL
ncbi:hypothetical protein A3A93_02340 [Candidatus Roizmanbacteria bacterium RIFCSPLOWO2_01_FULL_38_12]|uniref:riboflavin kinase n=1 Tax=Candidatus Roizmanbacteria bacterium RIFCSPLOWO2_01_FULL_38_12 TaxID=1802061 RepID=A0A1F7IWA9_9BACT|nr:MAG: hypothetical protein A3F59_02475 [Candidatus Roizmanbacteria bacterium RIFCSPHIGHO2_12_FULL_38_13]OGK47656.1 MAG: hypothetical protein A3A93_02340 [Candidatus Roizmanbacteria bacterium RIFCSPLOWO2_01_FULL_38_12]